MCGGQCPPAPNQAPAAPAPRWQSGDGRGAQVHVTNYVQKAEQTAAPDAAAEAGSVAAKLRAAAGLAMLDAKKFRSAARKFCDVPFDLAPDFGDFAAPQDVATYGGLCALASFDRQELRTMVRGGETGRENGPGGSAGRLEPQARAWALVLWVPA